VSNQFTYSASSDPDIEELTSVFEELSQTFEYGRRLNDLEVHDKKAIQPQLEAMRTKAERHALRDLPVLVPILRGLASDDSLDASVRKQAATLIAMASHSPQGFQ
jgi:nucleotide-binding universal stress UspA family protein